MPRFPSAQTGLPCISNSTIRLIGAQLLCLAVSLNLPAIAHAAGSAGSFDYYTLVLTWSPTYCANRKKRRFDSQCDSSRHYAFVLHGAWPQYNKGWPEFCKVKDNWVPRHVIDSMLDIMPSKKLIIHQWRKHGTCSGLKPEGYFKLARILFDQINIPPRYIRPKSTIITSPQEIEADFLKENPHIGADMLSVSCGRRKRLKGIRVCFGTKLGPIPCGPNDSQHRLCRQDRIKMPPVRRHK